MRPSWQRKCPYLQAPLLKEGEHESYGEFPLTAQACHAARPLPCGRLKRARPAARTACH